MHDRRVAGCDVQNLQVAAKILAVGHQPRLCGRSDAHVAERGPLHDVVVVRAHEQADVHRVGERYVGDLSSDERVTESRDGHQVHPVPPLELDNRVRVARQAVPRFPLLRDSAGRATELERRESVAVHRRGHVRAVGLERRANGPADLPMRLDSGADEARPRGENEVARHPLPHEMEIVVVGPHVLT